jgi:hypothetical protein
MIKDLYETFAAKGMQNWRPDWDNTADDVCFINPDPQAQEKAPGHEKSRQKKPADIKDEVEKQAWMSPANCEKVCHQEDVPDESDMDFSRPGEPRLKKELALEEHETEGEQGSNTGTTNAITPPKPKQHQQTKSAAEQEAARVKWRKAMDEKKKKRTCFAWRWNNDICCTGRSFKLGSPKQTLKENDPKRWVSGWHMKGIKQWIETAGQCKGPAWKYKLD